jgi:hypothetical protein
MNSVHHIPAYSYRMKLPAHNSKTLRSSPRTQQSKQGGPQWNGMFLRLDEYIGRSLSLPGKAKSARTQAGQGYSSLIAPARQGRSKVD